MKIGSMLMKSPSNIPRYTPQEYRTKLLMSNCKHVLVEGSSDKTLFILMRDELQISHNLVNLTDQIYIDTAENLKQDDDGAIANSDKVRALCKSLENKEKFRGKFVGFIDRELYEFEWEETESIEDRVEKHIQHHYLVWSRGHSIENYLFDFQVLYEPLRDFLGITYFTEVLVLFRDNFDSTLRIASALGLAAAKLGLLKRVRQTLYERDLIMMTSSGVTFDAEQWYSILGQRKDAFVQEEVNTLVEYYKVYYRIANNSSSSVIRWVCDGHIGFNMLWILLQQCVYTACPEEPDAKAKAARKVTRFSEEQRFHQWASAWTRKAVQNLCESPLEVFGLLGVFPRPAPRGESETLKI